VAAKASAADFYIAQTAQGSDSGIDCANAHAVTWFNTVGNWGVETGKISDGDTVYGCSGTVTTSLVPPASGSTNITFKAMPGFKLSKAAWGATASGAIYISGRSHLTFDGDGVGIIENTDNGTNLGNHIESNAVNITNGSYLTIKNWTMRNMYVRTPVAEPAESDSNAYGRIITVMNSPHLEIFGNTITYGKYGILVQASSGNPDGLLIFDNDISKCSTSIVAALAGATNYTGIKIHNNIFSDWTPWAGCWSSCAAWNHNDGIHLWGAYSGNIVQSEIYNNMAGGDITSHMTGLVFTEDAAKDTFLYNNVLYANAGLHPTDGFLAIGADYADANIRVFNNTIVGSGTGSTGGNGVYSSGATPSGTLIIKNNIIRNVYLAIWKNNSTTLTSDYNNINSVGYAGRISSTFYSSLASWQAIGYDAHSINSDPLLTETYAIPANSPAKGAGTDLSAYFTTDFVGTTRTVPWDIGAYEYQSSGDIIAPSVPSGLSVS